MNPSSDPMNPKRVLLKLSGEALLGGNAFGIDANIASSIATDIKQVIGSGVEVCLVIGGGNIYRGMDAASKGMDRVQGDYAGMLATVINAIVMRNVLESSGIETRVLSAIPLTPVVEPYVQGRAIHHMNKGRVVIFAAGTGNPYFTTDTAASLRAIEMNCDVMLKGTQVDGVYDSDPRKNPDAKRFDKLTYTEVLAKGLNVMDSTAISLARDNKLPIIVFDIHKKNAFSTVLRNEGTFTRVVSDS